MALTHAPLPFAIDALEPHMSARTFEFHHGKHHKTYIDNTNKMIADTDLEDADLVTIVKAAKEKGNKGLFNNSAQAWNHDFFWQSLSPNGGGKPEGKIAEYIERDFGSLDSFREKFKAEAVGHFASGWGWLILKDGKLEVTSYHDADTPIVRDGVTPLITVDVWEHAYYLDHQNLRPRFLDTFLDHLVNWEGAEEKLQAALK